MKKKTEDYKPVWDNLLRGEKCKFAGGYAVRAGTEEAYGRGLCNPDDLPIIDFYHNSGNFDTITGLPEFLHYCKMLKLRFTIPKMSINMSINDFEDLCADIKGRGAITAKEIRMIRAFANDWDLPNLLINHGGYPGNIYDRAKSAFQAIKSIKIDDSLKTRLLQKLTKSDLDTLEQLIASESDTVRFEDFTWDLQYVFRFSSANVLLRAQFKTL